MIPFSTEFPTQTGFDKASFMAQTVAWLRGNSNSAILNSSSKSDMDQESVVLQSPSGEELRLREYKEEGISRAIGFRHDIPDEVGRLWRTEVILQFGRDDRQFDLIRFRTVCIAQKAGAVIQTPLKPYLIRTILKDQLGGQDGELGVFDYPLWLTESEKSLEIASRLVEGAASIFLPVVYLSHKATGGWSLDKYQIDKLAYDLGGVAHVVAEPSRAFSFRLRDTIMGQNAYDGAISVSLPSRGIVGRFFIGMRIQDEKELVLKLKASVTQIRSQMPFNGWDWTELQEQSLKQQREQERNKLSVGETEALYDEEIRNLRDRIEQLQETLQNRPLTALKDSSDDDITIKIHENIMGKEIYPGEFLDRIRLAFSLALSESDRNGLDSRSKMVMGKVLKLIPATKASGELLKDILRATRDPKRVASDLTELLCRHGYDKKSENKHIRLESAEKESGLEAITVPKTPGEYKGLKNLRKQIERTLGISQLPR